MVYYTLKLKSNNESIIAIRRVSEAQLQNVSILCARIEDYTDSFDIGIALHACGGASDIVQRICVQSRAVYVMAPCCVGKVQTSLVTFPRSKAFQRLYSSSEYMVKDMFNQS